eukprot:6323753-Lingulodinium_polyedra.AAC.1
MIPFTADMGSHSARVPVAAAAMRWSSIRATMAVGRAGARLEQTAGTRNGVRVRAARATVARAQN